jgi:hypothetical protein
MLLSDQNRTNPFQNDLSSACVLVNFGKDYVYFGQQLVAKPTSYVPHEPHFLIFNIVSIILFYKVSFDN